MTAPVRLQLSRRRGFNLQELSRAINGLPAVNVARPSKWGNPYKFGMVLPGTRKVMMTTASLVKAHRGYIERGLSINPAYLAPLRGKNLACWCKPGESCHADVLLEIANK